MLMAPLNVQILPHHQQNGGGHKSKKSNQRRRNRSPKKFLVFPVEEVECQAGIGKAKGEGRIVTSKMDAWNWQQQPIKENGKHQQNQIEIEKKEEEIIIKELMNDEGKALKEEEKQLEMNEIDDATIITNENGMRKFGVEELIQVPTISKPKWTTGPMPIKAKVILLGESGVGKTSLVYSLKYGCSGLLPCNATIGAHHTNLDINAQHNGNVAIKMQIWDTAGQERFRSMIPMYLRNVNGALLVYDLTDRKSFEQIDFWIQELNRANASEEKAPILLLIGNKKDQEGQREVTGEEGIAKAEQIGADYFELAAVQTKAIRTIFQSLADQLAEKLSTKFDDVEEVNERTKLEECWGEGKGNSLIRIDEPKMFKELRELCKENGLKCCSTH